MTTSDALTALRRYAQQYIEKLPVEVETGPGHAPLTLWLRHVKKPGVHPDRSVLIVHGANSGSVTFLVPDGGFADYLAERGWDVWLLDWRGSPEVVDPLIADPTSCRGTVLDEIRLFSFDEAAKDVRAGVKKVRELIGPAAPLSVLGHCVGGGITSIAVARGLLAGLGVEKVALSTLGLFFEVPWDGWIKAEDFILERVLETELHRAIDPRLRVPWPAEMERAYERWPKSWQIAPHAEHRLLNRLSFMVGRPWRPDCIDPRIDDAILAKVFGNLHLGLYVHCGQMVRRGYAARFDQPDIIDRDTLALRADRKTIDDHLRPEPFRDLNVTLITAAQNRVWHRDSMDLMYEWLLAEARGGTGRFSKCVLHDYGLQEMFWAKNPKHTSYPALEEALRE